MNPAERTYRRLVARLPHAVAAHERWTLLMSAHIAGQSILQLHWDSHVRMLRQAVVERDVSEAAGQLLRLALLRWARQA